MASEAPKILFFPNLVAGHMLPMVDMARLFAARSAEATIFTTPANAALIRPSIAASTVRLHVVPFPSVPGLPDGVENFSAVAGPEMRVKFITALLLLREPFDRSVEELAPDCVVTDIFLPWTADVAAERGVPRIVFHGSNFFSTCALDIMDRHRHTLLENLPAEAESVAIPGLPHDIKLLKSQINHTPSPMMLELFNRVKEAESNSYGTVVNSFYELEPDYVEHCRRVLGKKAWHVGPVSLCNVTVAENSQRGEMAAIGHETCIHWLDNRTPGSVVYVCFGSLADFSAPQVRELALGLEASNRPFIWAVKKHNCEALPDGFEERTRERGLIIRGWAPQILILNHSSIGCFVTHCGWNSSLEGISAGLPMVTWPMFGEQFLNERLIVDVLKIGVAVGVKEYVMTAKETAEKRGVIGAGAVVDAVERVMGGEEEGEAEERRRRAKELGKMARAAVDEGGSSYVDMGNLMQELMERRRGSRGLSDVGVCVGSSINFIKSITSVIASGLKF